jgi:hypothetical protein
MLRLARARNGRVALGLVAGRFDPPQILLEVERAYFMGDLAPGMDSVILYEPGLEVGHVAVADLVAIRDCIARHEASTTALSCAQGRSYRGVIVAAEREAQIVARVYTATWQGTGELVPEHQVAGSLAEAEARLGVPTLCAEFSALRAGALSRYSA